MTQHRDVGNATDTACRSSFDVTLGLRTAHDRKLGWGVCRERERTGREGEGVGRGAGDRIKPHPIGRTEEMKKECGGRDGCWLYDLTESWETGDQTKTSARSTSARPQLVKRHRGDEEDTEYGIILAKSQGS